MLTFCRILLQAAISLFIAINMVACTVETTADKMDIPTDSFLPGDIAFRRGESLVSDIVLFNDKDGKYSHVGVIVCQDDSLMVAHAVPGEAESRDDFDRVKIEPIERFFHPDRAVHGEVMRLEISPVQRDYISRQAIAKAEAKIRFDHGYNAADTTKLYCTEFVQLIFANSGVDLCQGRVTHIACPGYVNDCLMPSDVYRNKNLNTIFSY